MYIPALKYHFLTPFYDLIIRILMPEIKVKNQILEFAEIGNGEKLLDFGCGTGTSLIIGKKRFPETQFIGLDVDSAILAIAEQKIGKQELDINLICSQNPELPFENNSSDKVISSWVFHHLTKDEKIRAFKEIKRILKPKGLFILADWGKPSNTFMCALFTIVQLFDNFETTQDGKSGKIPNLLKEAGFMHVEELKTTNTLFGTLYFWKIY